MISGTFIRYTAQSTAGFLLDYGTLSSFYWTISRSTMIDKRHPLTRSYAPSISRLKEAEKSHLVEHYYMIHPFSMFSFYFNMLVVVILVMHFIAAPVVYPLLEGKWIINMILLPVNGKRCQFFSLCFIHNNTLIVVCVLMIIISFCTGCYDGTHNVVIMKKGYVALRYLCTYFIFDILTFMPIILRFVGIDQELQKKSYHMTTPTMVIFRYARQVQKNMKKRLQILLRFYFQVLLVPECPTGFAHILWLQYLHL